MLAELICRRYMSPFGLYSVQFLQVGSFYRAVCAAFSAWFRSLVPAWPAAGEASYENLRFVSDGYHDRSDCASWTFCPVDRDGNKVARSVE